MIPRDPISIFNWHSGYDVWDLPDHLNVYSGWHLDELDKPGSMSVLFNNTFSPHNFENFIVDAIGTQKRPNSKATTEDMLNHKWLPIPWIQAHRQMTVPFGYKYDPEDPIFKDFPELDPKSCLVPIPLELVAFEKAKRLLKEYSKDAVREWLIRVTGREITAYAFEKRIFQENKRDRKSQFIRKTAAKLARAIEQAIIIETRYSGAGKVLPYDIWGEALDGKFAPEKDKEQEGS